MHDRVRSRNRFELILFDLVPLFLTLATVWILWHFLEKINPDEVTRHSGIRNHRVVGLVSNHCGGGCDRSESKGQKEPTYSVDLRFAPGSRASCKSDIFRPPTRPLTQD
jgi:hypothetical protein